MPVRQRPHRVGEALPGGKPVCRACDVALKVRQPRARRPQPEPRQRPRDDGEGAAAIDGQRGEERSHLGQQQGRER
eukprot:64045-Chlamydomonas_euryale.AAC.1